MARRSVKREIPADVRRQLATRYGCQVGKHVVVKCAYFDSTGVIYWIVRRKQTLGWVSISGLEIDHIVPESKGGETKPDNLHLACRYCNRAKGAKTIDEWMVR